MVSNQHYLLGLKKLKEALKEEKAVSRIAWPDEKKVHVEKFHKLDHGLRIINVINDDDFDYFRYSNITNNQDVILEYGNSHRLRVDKAYFQYTAGLNFANFPFDEDIIEAASAVAMIDKSSSNSSPFPYPDHIYVGDESRDQLLHNQRPTTQMAYRDPWFTQTMLKTVKAGFEFAFPDKWRVHGGTLLTMMRYGSMAGILPDREDFPDFDFDVNLYVGSAGEFWEKFKILNSFFATIGNVFNNEDTPASEKLISKFAGKMIDAEERKTSSTTGHSKTQNLYEKANNLKAALLKSDVLKNLHKSGFYFKGCYMGQLGKCFRNYKEGCLDASCVWKKEVVCGKEKDGIDIKRDAGDCFKSFDDFMQNTYTFYDKKTTAAVISRCEQHKRKFSTEVTFHLDVSGVIIDEEKLFSKSSENSLSQNSQIFDPDSTLISGKAYADGVVFPAPANSETYLEGYLKDWDMHRSNNGTMCLLMPDVVSRKHFDNNKVDITKSSGNKFEAVGRIMSTRMANTCPDLFKRDIIRGSRDFSMKNVEELIRRSEALKEHGFQSFDYKSNCEWKKLHEDYFIVKKAEDEDERGSLGDNDSIDPENKSFEELFVVGSKGWKIRDASEWS